MVTWDAVDERTRATQSVTLPKMLLGDAWLGENGKKSVSSVLVDRVKEFTGADCTVLQRMNEQGDMLRVATSVAQADGTRPGVGTYVAATREDGTPSPIIAAVLQGKAFEGKALAQGAVFQTRYFPIYGAGNAIIGALGVGAKLENEAALRQAVMSTAVGRTGYVFILGGKGEQRGKYIISRRGERDGENIWDTPDATGRLFVQDIVRKAMSLETAAVAFERYVWKNPGEPEHRQKISAITYFEPWDWVIAAGMYEDDYFATRSNVGAAVRTFLLACAVTCVGVLILAMGIAIFLSARMTRSLGVAIGLAEQTAAGNLQAAKSELDRMGATKVRDSANIDETGQLVCAMGSMISSLDALLGQVRRSGIQVSTSATEIAAAARQLEATISEQAASTNEVNATSKEISSTAEQLAHTIGNVDQTLGQTVQTAAAGQSVLAQMQTTMQRLLEATSTVSSKLCTISEKTHRISGIVTTINRISDQTNLLSLNAAIEAEKAGEYGRGFSVVAREIRRLADQTAGATDDIARMVKEMQSSVSVGVMGMDKFADDVRASAGEASHLTSQVGGIIDQVMELKPQFEMVKAGILGQSESAQQISEAMSQLAAAVTNTRDAVGEFNRTTDKLNQAVKGMQSEVSRFNAIC